MRNFRIEVYVHVDGKERADRDPSLDQVIGAPGEDKARAIAKARLEQAGVTVLGLAHSPGDVLTARVKRVVPKKPALVSGGVIR